MSSVLGLSTALPALSGCAASAGEFEGKVLVIGVGRPACRPISLAQRGIDFEILEANTVYGGFVNKTFTDFPIPLGQSGCMLSRKCSMKSSMMTQLSMILN